MTTYEFPARFALKGSNNKFLKSVPHKGQECLQFSTIDSSDVQTVFTAQKVNEYYAIKSEFLGKFWKRRDDNWIVANSPDCTDDNTHFWAVVVTGNKITLHNCTGSADCGMLTDEAWLSASGQYPVIEVIDLSLSS